MIKRTETVDIKRAEIKNAPYNPRTITPEHKVKLRQSLEEFGLVTLPVWNKRTGNLVSGHQRLGIMDDLLGTDYRVQVSVVDLDEDREKALNIILNSDEVAGRFDQDKLRDILDSLGGKLTFDLNALVHDTSKKADAKLKRLTVQKPPQMAWALIAIPLVRWSEISPQVEAIAAVPDALVETTFNDPLKKDGQSQSAGKA